MKCVHAVVLSYVICLAITGRSVAQTFERVVLDANFPGAYQVEVADVNGDGKLDVVAVGGATCAWYENPGWKKRVVSGPEQTPGIISSATADLDGDGKAEIAIAYEFAMEKPATGKLVLARQGESVEAPWRLEPAGAIPSIHRLRFGDIDGDGKLDLVVAPIFGLKAQAPDYLDPARLVVLRGLRPGTRTAPEFIGAWPVIHAIEVADHFAQGRAWIGVASDQGAGLVHLDPSQSSSNGRWAVERRLTSPADAPPTKRGASEIHIGKMADGRRLLATIEPWHGSVVAAYLGKLGPASEQTPDFDSKRDRQVVDDTLADGHALWLADVDGDGDDEILAGHRGKDHRVSLYDLDHARNRWVKTVLDRDISAQDLRGGDADGDGLPDVAAVGGQTRNVVLYKFKRSPR